MSRATSRGMIQIAGITYRVVRIEAHRYGVVRLSDDLEIGRFQTRPILTVDAEHVDEAVLFDVARQALRAARLSSVGHAAPEPPPRTVTPTPAGTTSSLPPAVVA